MLRPNVSFSVFRRLVMTATARKGLVLGFYEGETDGDVSLTKTALKFQEDKNQNLLNLLNLSGLSHKKNKARLFCGLDQEYPEVALTNLGKKGVGVNELEEVDEGRENVRIGVAAAVRLLSDAGVKSVYVDPCNDAEAAAEGAHLSTYIYDELKSADKKKPAPQLFLAPNNNADQTAWDRGRILSEAQNLARYLMESPANEMTPTIFARKAVEKLAGLENVTVTPRDKEWAKSMNMGAFLSVAQGSHQPPVFLEVAYKGADVKPLAFVGKGITFDTGGISIKPSANMDEMRADMGGAACVLSSIYAAAKLKLPVNLIGLMPMTENMPGGAATKPGDVHKAMNGKSIQAGIKSGDRVWRMPLFKLFTKQVTDCPLADVNNIGTAGRVGGACTAAAFLKEFVTADHWMHMDIAGVMSNATQVSYLPKGMSGRPTRTLVEFMTNFRQL